MSSANTDQDAILSFAHWVRDTIAYMRTSAPDVISLFESSVPEPVDLLRATINETFRNGVPDTYKSVFMRSNPDLVEQLASRYSVSESAILCTTGATTGISLIYHALLKPGDRILVEAPGFDIFTNIGRDMQLAVDFYQRPAPDFRISTDSILENLKADTKLVVLTNLHNPSGVYVSDRVLAELARALAERGVLLVLDEVYRDYLDAAEEAIDPIRFDNVIRIGSLTKNFGLSTLRCGWLFAGPRLLKQMRDFSDRTDFNVSRLSHCIATEVLRSAADYDGWRTDHMTTAQPVARQVFAEMEQQGLIVMGAPLQGCTCFPRVTGIDDTLALSRWLTVRHGIVVVPGECFAAPGFLRIGYGLKPDQLRSGLNRLAEGLMDYQKSGLARQTA